MSWIFEKLKNIEVWKMSVLIVLLLIMLVWSGYTVTTKWGSIYKQNPDDVINRKMTKIKAQTNYSFDMKTCVLMDLATLYEDRLNDYCRENNIQVSQDRIALDVKYYKLIIIAMSDVCENITIERYIHNNDLYRYTNKADWDVFKNNIVTLYLREGHQVLLNYYDNTKVIMPVQDWLRRKGNEIKQIMAKNTDKLLEDLKTESLIYFNSVNGGK